MSSKLFFYDYFIMFVDYCGYHDYDHDKRSIPMIIGNHCYWGGKEPGMLYATPNKTELFYFWFQNP